MAIETLNGVVSNDSPIIVCAPRSETSSCKVQVRYKVGPGRADRLIFADKQFAATTIHNPGNLKNIVFLSNTKEGTSTEREPIRSLWSNEDLSGEYNGNGRMWGWKLSVSRGNQRKTFVNRLWRQLRKLRPSFSPAIEEAPSIIFTDEIDVIDPNRDQVWTNRCNGWWRRCRQK